MILGTILIFIVILGLLIFVHELGHFIMAKRAGMKVEEFGFGFPPRLFGFKWKDTLYSINWIPLGGFVKILGEDGDNNEQGSFASKSAFRRFSVLVAGVAMNMIFAWVLISIGFMIGLPTLIDEDQTFPAGAKVGESSVTVLFVEPETPAYKEGLRAGDIIVALDGNQFSQVNEVQDYSTIKAGQPIVYEIIRGDDTLEVTIIPRVNPPEGQGAIGIALGLAAKVSYPWYKSIYLGFGQTLSLTKQIFVALGALVQSLFSDRALLGSLTGPVGIAVLTRDVAKLGFANLLQFTAVLSVNLAIINILPLPALDGGRVFFLIVEKLRRKKMRPIIEGYANTVGFFLLIALMVWVTVKDVGKFSEQFGNFFGRIF